MIEVKENYLNYLEKLNKKDIIDMIKDYHNICDIYDIEKGKNITKKNKKDMIEYLLDNIENYLPSIIKLIDSKDYEILNYIIHNPKKVKGNYISDNKYFFDYLREKKIIFGIKKITIPKDVFILIKNTITNKDALKEINHNTYIYDLGKGLIIAYGVIDKKMFMDRIERIDKKGSLKIEYYYKKNYKITKDKVVNNKISNKEKINKYLNNTVYKEFKNKELIKLARLTYHYKFKSYKKLLSTIKSNYIFKKEDIPYINEQIIIPYLYNSLTEEKKAFNELNKTIDNLFEFNDNKLKDKIIALIIEIRNHFPLWEYRGFSKSEV